MAQAKVTAQTEITRVAEALGWTREAKYDPYFGNGDKFVKDGRLVECYYNIDSGVKIAIVQENGHHADLISERERRERVVKALKGEDYREER